MPFEKWIFAGALPLFAIGCQWDDSALEPWVAPVEQAQPIALQGSVALSDKELDRLVFVTSDEPQELGTTAFSIGKNPTKVIASPDKSQLFVLSRGVVPATKKTDQGPQLQVFDGGTEPSLSHSFELDDPMSRLALDPEGQWVAAFGGDATVTNQNELVLLSLEEDAGQEPVSKTIRSFGGVPEELVFTDRLRLPEGGARRFLVVRTDRDVTLVDLKNLDQSEVTIRLPEQSDGAALTPAQVVFHDGDEEDRTDARIAIRLEESSDIVLLQLGPSDDGDRDFSVVVNIVDVGGVPSTLDFVNTDGGLRLAALVPGNRRAVLVNPETTLAESLELPASFSEISRAPGSESEADVALLWGPGEQVAFWELGSSSANPYRSIDATQVSSAVEEVIDVPPPNDHLKVLTTGSSTFVVVDLKNRESFPLRTTTSGYRVVPSPDGERLWVYFRGGELFSSVTLSDLHPSEISVSPGIGGVYEIERADGGRSVVVLHSSTDSWSATVLDAQDPNSVETSYFPAIFWESMK